MTDELRALVQLVDMMRQTHAQFYLDMAKAFYFEASLHSGTERGYFARLNASYCESLARLETRPQRKLEL